jgi:FKBP-type peptidyl-prolyl cis-trans isomerase FkpA
MRSVRPALVLLLASALASCGRETGGGTSAGSDPSSWDLKLLPDPGETLREVRTPGGAVYRVLREGEGAPAAGGEKHEIKYTGYHLTGGSFDSGVLPLPMSLIRGFSEGVAGIKLGEKRRILVPASLGYGAEGSPPTIGPNEDLVFDVERVPGVIVEDLRVGTGPEAKEGSEIEVHYKGTLRDGTTFDSSYERGKPNTFRLAASQPRRPGVAPVPGVIEGWIRGIAGMKVGGMRVLKVPAHLAYGPRGKPPQIPPSSDLEFVVELLGVK